VTTLKSLSQKLCPQSVYDSTFGRKERDYLGINAKASKRRNDTKKSRLAWLRCTCCCPKRKDSGTAKSIASRSNNNLPSLTNNNNNNIYSNNNTLTNNNNNQNTCLNAEKEEESVELLQETGLDENNNNIVAKQQDDKVEQDTTDNTNNFTNNNDTKPTNNSNVPQITTISPRMASQVNVISMQAFSENVNEFDYIDLDVLTKELNNSETTPKRRNLMLAKYHKSGLRSNLGGEQPATKHHQPTESNMELNLELLPLNSKHYENEIEC
jgi:hypothetical protein